MTAPEFDTKLMADTSEKMILKLLEELDSLDKSHGIAFSNSVAANIGIEMLTMVIAHCRSPEQQLVCTLQIAEAFKHNLQVHRAETTTSDVIAKAMKTAP